MMEAVSNDFWVWIESNKDGTVEDVSLELLTPGRNIADKNGGELVAVIFGNHTESTVKEVSSYGTDIIILIDHPLYKNYSKDRYTKRIFTLLEKYRPMLFMLGATEQGCEIEKELKKQMGNNESSESNIKIKTIKAGIYNRPGRKKNAAIVFRESAEVHD